MSLTLLKLCYEQAGINMKTEILSPPTDIQVLTLTPRDLSFQ